ncbi:MAG: GHMP kinase [Flavobacteriaceae bacterium]|nr:GHMP kinase [Flavobacteriaceae bacterium]
MKQTFYSNGKLLITGEYLVLDGARAFALPTKFGQSLIVEQGNNNEIEWTSYDADGSIWFKTLLPFATITSTPDPKGTSIEATLITILHQAYLANSAFIDRSKGLIISTQLTFPRKWGLGTSSTLINNIAQWTQINAFTLLKSSFGGSGYDIACAQNDEPIIYQIDDQGPKVEKVLFEPPFSYSIYFVYLNKKQNSKTAISNYQNNTKTELAKNVAMINNLTTTILHAPNLRTFTQAIQKHEALLSHLLETSTVQENLFPDFDGTIKSLGAWGGDFVMVISETNPKDYFKSKGFETVLSYNQMIL